MTFLYAYDVLKRLFVRLIKPIYKTMYLRRISSPRFLCPLLIIIIITVRGMLIQTDLVQPPLFRYRFRAICCEFGEFRMCRCFVHRTNYIIHLEETQTKKTWNVDLLDCSNSYFSKAFGCF